MKIQIFFVTLCLLFCSCSHKEKYSTVQVRTSKNDVLIALNQNSINGSIKNLKKDNFLLYKFSPSLLSELAENESIKLNLHWESGKSQGSDLNIGFLYPNNFSKDSRYNQKTVHKSLVQGDFSKMLLNDFSVAISWNREETRPLGFFIQSQQKIELKSVDIPKLQAGKNLDDKTAEFYFTPDGGTIEWNFDSIDFSGAVQMFGRNATTIEIQTKHLNDVGTSRNQTKIALSYGKEKLFLRKSPYLLSDKYEISHSAFKESYQTLKVEGNQNLVTGIIMSWANNEQPIKTDLGLIMEWPQENWRNKDFELFEWNLFPGVLFFDFKNYKIQNNFFTRLAYFVEKEGYKGTLVSDWFVENKHGYNAHDYKAEDMAAFFNEAERTEFNLNTRELLLKNILLENKIIYRQNGMYYPSEFGGAVISFSRESPDYLRHTFMAHESWHGIYFTNTEFRNIVSVCYNLFDSRSMDFIKTFWSTQPGLNYDTNDDYLMKNEFMAYIMQQSYSNIKPYFIQVCNRGSVQRNQKAQADYVISTGAQAFLDAGKVLDDFAFEKWGLAAGRVSLIYRD